MAVAPAATVVPRAPATAGTAAYTDGMAATAAGQAPTAGLASCNVGAYAKRFAYQAAAMSQQSPSACDCCAGVGLTGAHGLQQGEQQGQLSLSPSQASGQVRSVPMSLQAALVGSVTPAYLCQHGQEACIVCAHVCVLQAAVAEQQQQQQQQQQWSQLPSMNWHAFLEETPSSAAQEPSPTSLRPAWQPSRNHASQVQSWAGITPASKYQAAAPSPWAEAAAPMGRPESSLANSLEPTFNRSRAATISQPPDLKMPFQASMPPRQGGQQAARLVSSLPISGKSPQPSQDNNVKRASQANIDAASNSDEYYPTILSVFDGL